MANDADNRVAVYIDFDNMVISRYNQLHGRGQFQADRARNVVTSRPNADPEVVRRLKEATVDIGAILDYASSFGSIVISRAYADWSQPINASYQQQLVDRAIDLTQMFPLSATKNGADIRLAVDVVEDLFRLNDVTHVVLVSGDSDYVALAQRAKRLGRYIVGIGVTGATNKSLPAACNDFSFYDYLPGIGSDDAEPEPAAVAPVFADQPAPAAATWAPATRATSPKSAMTAPVLELVPSPDAAEGTSDGGSQEQTAKMLPRAASTLLRRALELSDAKNDEEWLHTSAIKLQMKRMDPSFHEKSLGFASFTDFVKSRPNIAEIDKTSNGQRMRLRPAPPAK